MAAGLTDTPHEMEWIVALIDARAPKPDPCGPNKGAAIRFLSETLPIHLMTYIQARDVPRLDDIIFHTFDDGKGKNWEGNCFLLLIFHEWTNGTENNETVIFSKV